MANHFVITESLYSEVNHLFQAINKESQKEREEFLL
jgi:hypothetical protein